MALVWAVAGFCFIPVIIGTMIGWLAGGEEFQRVRDENQRATVRGWGTRPGQRPTSSA